MRREGDVTLGGENGVFSVRNSEPTDSSFLKNSVATLSLIVGVSKTELLPILAKGESEILRKFKGRLNERQVEELYRFANGLRNRER